MTESVLEEHNIFTPKSPAKLNKWADAPIKDEEVKVRSAIISSQE